MAANGQSDRLFPVAGVLAYALPGLGYAYLGEVRRGVLVAIGVLGLTLGGLLVGGLDVVDRQEDKWWFVLQAGIGPVAWGVDAYHQQDKGLSEPRITRSLGRVNEVGSLYIAMAGMLNAIVVIDCAWRSSGRSERRGSRR